MKKITFWMVLVCLALGSPAWGKQKKCRVVYSYRSRVISKNLSFFQREVARGDQSTKRDLLFHLFRQYRDLPEKCTRILGCFSQIFSSSVPFLMSEISAPLDCGRIHSIPPEDRQTYRTMVIATLGEIGDLRISLLEGLLGLLSQKDLKNASLQALKKIYLKNKATPSLLYGFFKNLPLSPLSYSHISRVRRVYTLIGNILMRAQRGDGQTQKVLFPLLERILGNWVSYSYILDERKIEKLSRQMAQAYLQSLKTNPAQSPSYLKIMAKAGLLDGVTARPILFETVKRTFPFSWDEKEKNFKRNPILRGIQKKLAGKMVLAMIEILGQRGEHFGFSQKILPLITYGENCLWNSPVQIKSKVKLRSLLWYRMALGSFAQGNFLRGSSTKNSPSSLSYCLQRISKDQIPESWLLESRLHLLLGKRPSASDFSDLQPAYLSAFSFRAMAEVTAIQMAYQQLSHDHTLSVANEKNQIVKRYKKLVKKCQTTLKKNLAFLRKGYGGSQQRLGTDREALLWIQSVFSLWPTREDLRILQETVQALTLKVRLESGLQLAKSGKSLSGIDPSEFIPLRTFEEYQKAFREEAQFLTILKKYQDKKLKEDFSQLTSLYRACITHTQNRQELIQTLRQADYQLARLEVEGVIQDRKQQAAILRYQIAGDLSQLARKQYGLARVNLLIKKIQKNRGAIEKKLARSNKVMAFYLKSIEDIKMGLLSRKYTFQIYAQKMAQRERDLAKKALGLTREDQVLLARRWKLKLLEKKNVLASLVFQIQIKHQALASCLSLSAKMRDQLKKRESVLWEKIKGEEARKALHFWGAFAGVFCRVVGTVVGVLVGNPTMGLNVGAMVGDTLQYGITGQWQKGLLHLAGQALKVFGMAKGKKELKRHVPDLYDPLIDTVLDKISIDKIVEKLPTAIDFGQFQSWVGSAFLSVCREIPEVAKAYRKIKSKQILIQKKRQRKIELQKKIKKERHIKIKYKSKYKYDYGYGYGYDYNYRYGYNYGYRYKNKMKQGRKSVSQNKGDDDDEDDEDGDDDPKELSHKDQKTMVDESLAQQREQVEESMGEQVREGARERAWERMTESFTREVEVSYQDSAVEKKDQKVLFQDSQVKKLSLREQSNMERIIEKYQGVTEESVREILTFFKKSGKFSKAELAKQCRKLALAVVNFKLLQKTYPSFARFVFLPHEKKVKLIFPYIGMKAEIQEDGQVISMIRYYKGKKGLSWREIRQHMDRNFRKKFPKMTSTEWESVVYRVRMYVDSSLASKLVTASMKDFSQAVSQKVVEVRKEAAKAQDVAGLKKLYATLKAFAKWLGKSNPLIGKIEGDLAQLEQKFLQAKVEKEITALDQALASKKGKFRFIEAQKAYEQAMVKVAQSQLYREGITLELGIGNVKESIALLRVQQAQHSMDVVQKTLLERKQQIVSASIQLEMASLKKKVARKKINLSQVMVQIGTLRSRAHKIKKGQLEQQMEWLLSRLRQSEIQHTLLPLSARNLLDRSFTFYEIQTMSKESVLRAFFYLQAMRSILERVHHLALNLPSRLKKKEFNLLTLREWDQFLSHIYYRKLDNVFSRDLHFQLKKKTKTIHIQIDQRVNVNISKEKNVVKTQQEISVKVTTVEEIQSLVRIFLEKGNMEFLLSPGDFPAHRGDATLASVEVYFLSDVSYRQAVPLTVTLRGPFVHSFYSSRGQGFFQTFVQRKWEAYMVKNYPPVKTTYSSPKFSRGFWYLSPFCTWQIEADWQGIDVSKIRGVLIRLYYHSSQPERK